MNGRTRGAIAGTALAVGVLTGGLWSSATPAATPRASTCHVFAGRAGTLPCQAHPAPENAVVRKVVGSTFTGCLVGLASGGFAGAGYGCLGGLASNIPW